MDQKRKIILHYMALVGALASMVQTFVYIFVVGSILWSVMCFVSGLMFGLVYLLNKYEKHNEARVLYFCFASLFILAFGLFLGSGNGMHYYYIPLLSVLFVLYDYSQSKRIIFYLSLFILVAILLLIVLEGKFNLINVEPSFMRLIYLSNFITSLVVTLMAVYHVVTINMAIEKKMSHVESNLKAVFNNATETLFIIGADYKLIEFNRAAAKQVKLYSGLELKTGENVFDFIKDEDDFKTELDRALMGEAIDYVKEVQFINGEANYYHIKITPIRNICNEIVAVSSTGLNVTEKVLAEKEVKRRKKLLATIIDELPDAIFLTDAHTKKILSCNTGAIQLFQVDSEEELKSVKGEVFHKHVPDKTFFQMIEESLQTRHVWRSEVEYVTKKGKEFWGALFIKRIVIDANTYDLVRISDISKKVKEKEDLLAFVEMKKRDIANQQKQKNLSLIIHGQEKERQRFSKELHDGIGQMLTAIRLQVSALEAGDNEATQAQRQKINKTIDSTIAEVKRISSNLMPSAIEDFGLLGAIEHLCNLVPPTMVVEFVHDAQLDSINLTQKEKFAIYRIAQEAINNAVKYSGASKMKVLFTQVKVDESMLQIQDNGKGFKQDKLMAFYQNHTIGSGLSNMKERADLIQARFSINSQVGEGTSINLFIPLHKKAE
ncbi:MAG: PAS domain-containing sensor histidine kinase [Flavobacteriales bacterium]